MRIVRFYPELRSAHLERMASFEDSRYLYFTRRSDFDPGLLREGRVSRVSHWGLLSAIWSDVPEVLEVPEPMWFRYSLDSIAVVAAVRLRGIFGSGRTTIVSYAIENSAVDRVPGALERLPAWIWRALTTVALKSLVPAIDHLAFGSVGALEAMRDAVGCDVVNEGLGSGRWKVIPALPSPCDCSQFPRSRNSVLFLGSLDERKGFHLLVKAWPTVVKTRPDMTLTIVGEGPLSAEAEDLAKRFESVQFLGSQMRAGVHEQLRRNSMVVLPSQPRHRWREQLGLPVVEALAHGCSVVTSTETGLAPWLCEQGAEVLTVPTSVEDLLSAILRSSDRYPYGHVWALPELDGRVAADRWLLS